MRAVRANCDRSVYLDGVALASRPHPAAKPLVVQFGPNLEKTGSRSAGSLLLVLEQGRRGVDQVGIVCVLSQSRHELACGDQSVLLLTERILDARRQAGEITGQAQCAVARC